jgi:hypothetical protein
LKREDALETIKYFPSDFVKIWIIIILMSYLLPHLENGWEVD